MLVTMLLVSVAATATLLVHSIPARLQRVRLVAAVLATMTIAGSVLPLLMLRPSFANGMVAVLGLFQAFNMLRILKGRMHGLYLWHVTFRTSLWIIASQYVVIGLAILQRELQIPVVWILAASGLLQFVLAIIFVRTVWNHSRRMRAATRLGDIHDNDLPSLTVAIPARNETDDLEACITSLLAAQYPKLEILVLDDCSQTARTPEIIREFAHDGVRFIQGKEPQATWLAKNQAYATLAAAASGEMILFAGVDIRFEPGSLRQLVAYATTTHKSMVSLMPHNILPPNRLPLIQPIRYAWELVLPRRVLGRPPVLSSCWLISKHALADAGGFQAAARMVVPETYFATRLTASDNYSFIASGPTFGVTSVKSTREQRNTAERVAYPLTHRRPEIVALFAFGLLTWVGLPMSLLAFSFAAGSTSVFTLAVLLITLTGLSYSIVLRLSYDKPHPLLAICFPIAALVYLVLLLKSMYKYEFSEVIWKSRNVCVPVMHVIPSLPKI